ncbi:hypothetical protein AX16_010661 [Volvariella volvacea WC 439]|nr:hypothetical protein AX16_010661 [Volvariella volvacea WC 439]
MAVAVSIWSRALVPGKEEVIIPDEDICITNAALGDELDDSNSRTTVKLIYTASPDGEDEEDEEESEETTTILCSLTPGKIEQTTTNLVLSASQKYSFKLSGKNTIYLTGNYIVQGGFDNPPDDDSDLSMNEYGFDDDDSDVELDDEELESDASRFEEIVEEGPKKAKRARPSDDMDVDDKKETAPKKQKNTDGKAVPSAGDVESKKNEKNEEHREKEKDVKREKKEKKEKAVDGNEKKENNADNAEKNEKSADKGSLKKRVERELPGGLKITDHKVGTGPAAKKGNTISVRYIGKLPNGKVFDSNTKGKPFRFKLGKNEVIKGWDEGIVGMQVGGERVLVIPPSLGYGDRATGNIPPRSTLRFEVKLLEINQQVAVWPETRPTLVVGDPQTAKGITSSRARFPKPVVHYKVLTFFGRNIIASEGEEWKKYRKISAPAFNDRNNKLVWNETVKIVSDMFDQVWENRDYFTDHCVDITLPIALFVIGVAGFGRRISWKDEETTPPGHQLTFKNALHIVTTDIFLKLIFPDWVMGLTGRLRQARQAFQELEMREMIQERKTSDKAARYDLFSSLLNANDSDFTEQKLLESELIGDIFIFLVAGHETTAHTLCFTFALLALYQDEQQKLYEHINSVIPGGNLPSYEQMPLFTYSMAVFYETLRMYPPVTAIPKRSAQDTTLTTSNASGDKLVIPVPEGTDIMISTPALHYNPRYWEDPNPFNPSQFLRDWPRDAFIPFSAGARACIGRKFFETEGIAILTMLVSKYKIEVKPEPEFANESFEERRARVLSCRPGITLTPNRVPLVFKRRSAN